MIITRNGAYLFSDILKTCMFEKGETLSSEQTGFLSEIEHDALLEDFANIFPVEKETIEKVVETAIATGKKEVDMEVILSFFGGRSHMEHVREDFLLLPEDLVDKLLIFHLVVPVRLEKRGDELAGVYKNGNIEFVFSGIENVGSLEFDFNKSDQRALIHFGSIFDVIPAGSREEKILLKIQAENELFMKICREVRCLDCEGLLRALQIQKRWASK